jgi:hypothetical protein
MPITTRRKSIVGSVARRRAKENRGREAAAIGIRADRSCAPSVLRRRLLRRLAGRGRRPRRRLVRRRSRLALRRLTRRLSWHLSWRLAWRLPWPVAPLRVAHAEVRVLRAAGFDEARVDGGQRLGRPRSLRHAHHDRADAVDHDALAGADAVLDESRLQADLPDGGARPRRGLLRLLLLLLRDGGREPHDRGGDEGWQE